MLSRSSSTIRIPYWVIIYWVTTGSTAVQSTVLAYDSSTGGTAGAAVNIAVLFEALI